MTHDHRTGATRIPFLIPGSIPRPADWEIALTEYIYSRGNFDRNLRNKMVDQRNWRKCSCFVDRVMTATGRQLPADRGRTTSARGQTRRAKPLPGETPPGGVRAYGGLRGQPRSEQGSSVVMLYCGMHGSCTASSNSAFCHPLLCDDVEPVSPVALRRPMRGRRSSQGGR